MCMCMVIAWAAASCVALCSCRWIVCGRGGNGGCEMTAGAAASCAALLCSGRWIVGGRSGNGGCDTAVSACIDVVVVVGGRGSVRMSILSKLTGMCVPVGRVMRDS